MSRARAASAGPAGRIHVRGATLEVRRLVKTFGDTRVVDDVSFRIDSGKLLTLLGPSGSGKTTTLRMIAGFEEPTAGEILVGGVAITDMPAHRRNIGVVFQQYALFPHLTVAQNIAYPLEMRKRPRDEIRARVEAALDLVRLAGYGDRYPRQLSGGQQQRVALARAVVFEPPLLLMDEPLGALDKRLREVMQVEVRHLQQELGITTVSVTHDQVEALVMSDVIAVLDGGILQQIGPPLDVYRRPANQFVADFIGESNLLSGTVSVARGDGPVFTTAKGLAIRIAAATGAPALSGPTDAGGSATQPGPAADRRLGDQPGQIPGQPLDDHSASGPAHLVIRPEYVRLGNAAAVAGNRYAGEILEVLYVGDLVKYRVLLDTGDELIAKTLAPSAGRQWETGQRVDVGWDPADGLTVNS